MERGVGTENVKKIIIGTNKESKRINKRRKKRKI
jgi:hypothetical protein